MLNKMVEPMYDKIVMRKLRFSVRSHTKQSEDRLMNRIIETFKEHGKDLCLLCGDWSQGQQMKHLASTPNVGLLRKLMQKIRVLKVDEYKTSCTCHKCFGKNSYCKTRSYTKKGEKKTVNVHGLLRCTNESCGKLWNRDVCGGKNIKFLGDFWVDHRNVPEPFRRS